MSENNEYVSRIVSLSVYFGNVDQSEANVILSCGRIEGYMQNSFWHDTSAVLSAVSISCSAQLF